MSAGKTKLTRDGKQVTAEKPSTVVTLKSQGWRVKADPKPEPKVEAEK